MNYVSKNLSFRQLLELLLNGHNELNRDQHHKVFSYGRELAEEALFRHALRMLDKLANKCFPRR